MAEDKRYSIISVAPDEDEDIVIQAGVVEPDAGASASPKVAVAAEEAAGRDGAHPAQADTAVEAGAEEQGPRPTPVDDEGLTDEERRRVRRAHARAAELERLNETERQLSEKTEQSGMHKTVLALFAVGVVVCAALYYAFFIA